MENTLETAKGAGQEGNGCGYNAAAGGVLADGKALYLERINVNILVMKSPTRCCRCGNTLKYMGISALLFTTACESAIISK